MALSVWNGTSWVASTGVKVWNGSSWVSASAGKVWNGTSWVDFLTKISITDQSISASFPGQGQASAVYSLRADGYVYIGEYATVQSFTQVEQWCTPAGQASNYEALVTMTQNTLTFGTVGSWVALDADQYWRLTATGPAGDKTAQFSVQIRKIGTTTVLDTATINLSAFCAIA
jgi:hypothetical protein